MSRWTTKDIPCQTGRTAMVTGTGGIGFEDSLALARAGAEVIIAGRNRDRGREAVSRISKLVPDAKVSFEAVDLASIQSVHEFGTRMRTKINHLDVLINNAAVMAPPQRKVTKDGFELQFHTNYLGPFLLTADLLPLLKARAGARVVTVSSVAARNGTIQFDDLQFEKNYNPMRAYGQSKLADLLFTFELQKKSLTEGWGIESFAAHPGISRTDLIVNGSGALSPSGIVRIVLGPILFQSAAQGALPTLFAATSNDAIPGTYYGPDKMAETRGFPKASVVPTQALDGGTASRLWEVTESLLNIRFGHGVMF